MQRLAALLFPAALLLAAPDAAQDVRREAHWSVRLNDLALEPALPHYGADEWSAWRRRDSLRPRVVLAGEGEAYFASPDAESWAGLADQIALGRVVARGPAGADLRGRLFVPTGDWKRMSEHAFTLPAAAATEEAATDFLRGKAEHYRVLLDRDVPGAAWFRHRFELARAALGDEAVDLPRRWSRGQGESELERSFALFSGGRAVSENLQLDRGLQARDEDGELVELASLRGIETEEMDWKALLADASPALDPLAVHVPADQHAVFFPTFDALVDVLDEVEAYGAPALTAFEARSESALTQERYERQLCLSLDELARAFGSLAVASVAFTGSDPYLRTGSDVALLFEAKSPAPVEAFVRGRQKAAADSEPGCEPVEGTLAGTSYHGVRSPGRAVSSYVAALGNVVVVSNSLHQLERVLACTEEDSLVRAPEYRFFRERYALGQPESALLVLTDATIRRWCGPRWRIATSRRVRAGAALAELQAENLVLMADLKPGARPELAGGEAFPSLGGVRLTADGVESSVHGTLRFQTPIAELPLERVTRREARLYEAWRDGYQRNWSRVFDPIAARFVVGERSAGLDVTVIPLILGTDYDELLGFTGDARLDPTDGDPHPETVLHFAMALDPESEGLRGAGEFLTNAAARFGASPMSWLGGSFAVWAEDSPVWKELGEAMDTGDFEEDAMLAFNEIPLGVVFEVRSGLKLAAFLAAVRAFVEETAPGMIEWSTLPHGEERRYVRISSSMLTGDPTSLFYATLPTALVISLNEDALERAIDRLAPAPREDGAEDGGEGAGEQPASAAPTARPWLGESAALDLKAGALDMLRVFGDEDLVETMQVRAWTNLPILNEWRRVMPGVDAPAFHERLWGERLVCPGGGEYVWNEDWRTYESTVYGHPGEPKDGPGWPRVLQRIVGLRTGVTFEHDGLRARLELERAD